MEDFFDKYHIDLTPQQSDNFLYCFSNCLAAFFIFIFILILVNIFIKDKLRFFKVIRSIIICIILSLLFIDLSPFFILLWMLGIFG